MEIVKLSYSDLKKRIKEKPILGHGHDMYFKNCGNFKATNPNILNRHLRAKSDQANELNSNSASIKINEGDLLIFPAYLPHSVEENRSDEDRVIVSFNIDILK